LGEILISLGPRRRYFLRVSALGRTDFAFGPKFLAAPVGVERSGTDLVTWTGKSVFCSQTAERRGVSQGRDGLV
jgi:hypothetical protein